MPTYSISGPDGKTYSIDGPPNATREQVIAAVQGRMQQSPRQAGPVIPGQEDALDGNRNVGKPDESSFLDKVTGGIEAARALVTGVTTGAVGYIGGALGGVAKSVADGEFGTMQGVRHAKESAEAGAANLTYQPKSDKGIEYTQNVAHAIDRSGIVGLPIGPELGAMSTMARPAARQAAEALSTEAYIAKNLAQKAHPKNLVPTVDPDKAALAQKARDMGITIPPHALSDNTFLRMTGEFLDNLPFSGSNKESNKTAFNRYLADQIGGDATAQRLTPEVFAQAQEQAGQTIGDTFRNLSVPASDAQFVADLTDLVQAQGRELDPTRNLIHGNIKELARIADDNGGAIPGTTLKKMHSEVLGKLRSNLDAYPGMREQLSSFQQILEDAAARQITDPAIQSAYDVARAQYAKSKTLEPLVAKGGIDGVSPQALLGRVTATSQGKHRMATGAAGELGDAAQVAQQFMKEQPSSRTAERGFVMGAATELAGLGKAALGATVANVYNRFGPRLAQAMIDHSIAKRPPVASFPHELALAEESAFAARAAATPEPQYNGLLHLADDTDPAYAIGGHENALSSPALVPDAERLATRQTVPAMEVSPQFAAKQDPALTQNTNEWMRQFFGERREGIDFPSAPEVMDAFRNEDSRLTHALDSASDAGTWVQAWQDRKALRDEFEKGSRSLPIQKTLSPAERNQQAVDRVAGEAVDREWTKFGPDSGTLAIDRSEMPQIKAEHRGAMVNFLNARGIAHQTGEMPAASLKPTQAEFSPAKVQQARDYRGGERSILVSNDNHVLDGHHQWLASMGESEPVKVIRLDAPIDELIQQVKAFPSAETAASAAPGTAAMIQQRAEPPPAPQPQPAPAPQPQPAVVREPEHASSDDGADIPLAFYKRVKVPHEVWIESENGSETVDVPADQALASVRDEIDALQALLNGMKA